MPVTRQLGMIRPNLLKRLKENSGMTSDDAFARSIGVSRATLDRLRRGAEPSVAVVILIAKAYGLALGEVLVMCDDSHVEDLAVVS